MDLSDFLKDESFGGGSWADDDLDFSTIAVPSTKNFGQTGIPTGGANPRDPAFGGSGSSGPRGDYVEYPIPDAPPYRVRMNNLPWDASEDSIADWIHESLQATDAVQHISAPRDFNDPSRLRGFAFVTLASRDDIENILKFSGNEMFGRRVYVAVAAPEKEGFGSRRREDADLDWGSARSGAGAFPQREGGREFQERRPRREEPDLDWGSARSGAGAFPQREGGREFQERRPRREEPDLDWGSARAGAASLPQREGGREFHERKPRREEPELDWGSARAGAASLPQREGGREFRERRPKKEGPELDWGSARGSGSLPQRERKPKKAEPEFDWGSARGSGTLPPRQKKVTASADATKKEDAPKPIASKSAFSVLAAEDDEEEEEEEPKHENAEETPAEESNVKVLIENTGKLAVGDSDAWEVVGKK